MRAEMGSPWSVALLRHAERPAAAWKTAAGRCCVRVSLGGAGQLLDEGQEGAHRLKDGGQGVDVLVPHH